MLESILSDMSFTEFGALLVIVLLAASLSMLAVGRWLGARQFARDTEGEESSTGVVDGAVFGLMGLLLGFTFSHAAARFDDRREIIVDEANCIGTAWLRLDLLPKEAQPELRDKFRQYLDTRLSAFSKVPDMKAVNAELQRAGVLQQEIWNKAIEACKDFDSPSTTMLLLPAMNQMFDIASTRAQGAQMHPPGLINGMLLVLVLVGSLLAGHRMGLEKVHSWLHAIVFVLVISIAIYVIFDFEHPRIGLIRLNSVDRVLVELRETMNP